MRIDRKSRHEAHSAQSPWAPTRRQKAGALLLASLVATCGDTRVPEGAVAADTADTAQAAPAAARDSLLFDSRVAVFLEASSAALDSLRAELPEDDYYVVADDMLYYRSTAYEYLERLGLPVRRLQGRPPLRFVIDGAPQPHDLSTATTLDVIVLYEPGKQPQMIAPVEVEAVNEYFGLPVSR